MRIGCRLTGALRAGYCVSGGLSGAVFQARGLKVAVCRGNVEKRPCSAMSALLGSGRTTGDKAWAIPAFA